MILNVIKEYKNPAESRLLEIGCGNGRFGKLLSIYFKKYCGIDIKKELIEEAKKNDPNSDYKVGSAENIPFDKQFDIVFFSYSFHTIKDQVKALEESKRVLKPNGIIVVLEPSEHTRNWMSPKLRKGPGFEEGLYKRKINYLKESAKYLESQSVFKIIGHDYDKKSMLNLWILR